MPESTAPRIWAALVGKHAEPHRHYHVLKHVDAMLGHLDETEAADPPIELAIWFHDSIHDPKAKDNEASSAAFFMESFGNFDPLESNGKVVRLILATDHSRSRTGDPEEDLIRDIDLSILGAPASEYQAYSRAIRKEYAHVPDEAFAAGRRAVLERFLARKIFHSPAFTRLENGARRNIRAELESI